MNLFRRADVRYGRSPAPETPYQRAAAVWDERIGSARMQARNWRLIALGELAVVGGLALGLVWQSARGTVTPWVVQIDRLGQAQALAPASADYEPTDGQIAWHLARIIEEVRGVPADPIVVRQNWFIAQGADRPWRCWLCRGAWCHNLGVATKPSVWRRRRTILNR